jgi:MoaA/NifB/PqqE/SkfB family radical SAM enzyme
MSVSIEEKIMLAKAVFNGFRVAKPTAVTVAISSKCVNQCIFCPTNGPCMSPGDYDKIIDDPIVGKHSAKWLKPKIAKIEWMKKNRPFMTFTQYQKIARELVALGVKDVWLIGFGEPLLNPDAQKIIEYSCKKFPTVGLTSNGDLLNKKWMNLFAKNKVHLGISLDAYDQESRRIIHGVPESDFNQILALAKQYKDRLPGISASFVLNKLNFKQVETFLDKCKDAGIRGVGFYRLMTVPGSTDLQLTNEEYRAVEKKITKYQKENPDMCPGPLNVNETLQKDFSLPCFEPMRFFLINSDGSVFGCNRGYQAMGNVLETSVSAVWNGKAYRDFRKKAFYDLRRNKKDLPDCACYECGCTNPLNREIFEWGKANFGWKKSRFQFFIARQKPRIIWEKISQKAVIAASKSPSIRNIYYTIKHRIK